MDGGSDSHLSSCVAPGLVHRYRQTPVQRQKAEGRAKAAKAAKAAKKAKTHKPATSLNSSSACPSTSRATTTNNSKPTSPSTSNSLSLPPIIIPTTISTVTTDDNDDDNNTSPNHTANTTPRHHAQAAVDAATRINSSQHHQDQHPHDPNNGEIIDDDNNTSKSPKLITATPHRPNWYHFGSRSSARRTTTSPSVPSLSSHSETPSSSSASGRRQSEQTSPTSAGRSSNNRVSSEIKDHPLNPVPRKRNDSFPSSSAGGARSGSSLTDRLTAAYAFAPDSPPANWSLPDSPWHLPFFHHNNSDDNNNPSSSEPRIPQLSSRGIEPLHPAESRSFLRAHYERMSKQQPYQIPEYKPPMGSSMFATMSGVMTSNDTLLSSSLDKKSHSGSTSSACKQPPQQSNPKPLVVRNNRTYISDPTLPYPLPVDLTELHRQSIRTLLMFQLFGGPILSRAFASKPPARVLEIGCGSGFWSMMCHRYFAQHGHSSISFTGLDIVPLASSADTENKPDKDMRWRFVQHDIRSIPWPFMDEEFDLVVVKDMSMVSSFRESQAVMEEYLRVLKPGGILEAWETDTTIRMLRPQVVKAANQSHDDDDSSMDEDDDESNMQKMGAYIMTTNTPMSPPQNPFLVEYNGWVTKALETRGLSAVPCTLIGAYILQEAEILTDVISKRLAIPLSEIRWEREGVGGVVTKDGKSYINSQKGVNRNGDRRNGKGGKALTPAQAALRRTALESTIGLIMALEPVLREVSGKSQEDWDSWAAKLSSDLLREGGASWGECLEVGVWSSKKKLLRN